MWFASEVLLCVDLLWFPLILQPLLFQPGHLFRRVTVAGQLTHRKPSNKLAVVSLQFLLPNNSRGKAVSQLTAVCRLYVWDVCACVQLHVSLYTEYVYVLVHVKIRG